jgi:hypothetical protein
VLKRGRSWAPVAENRVWPLCAQRVPMAEAPLEWLTGCSAKPDRLRQRLLSDFTFTEASFRMLHAHARAPWPLTSL